MYVFPPFQIQSIFIYIDRHTSLHYCLQISIWFALFFMSLSSSTHSTSSSSCSLFFPSHGSLTFIIEHLGFICPIHYFSIFLVSSGTFDCIIINPSSRMSFYPIHIFNTVAEANGTRSITSVKMPKVKWTDKSAGRFVDNRARRLQILVKRLNEASIKIGMKINVRKAKVMKVLSALQDVEQPS